MKRAVSLILCVILTLAALSGCSEMVPVADDPTSSAPASQANEPAAEQSAKGLNQPDRTAAVPVNGFAQALYYDGGVYYINANSDLCRLEDGESTGVVLAALDDFGGYFSQIFAITDNGYAYLSGGRYSSDARRSVAVDLYTGEETVLTYPGASGEPKPLAIEFIWNEWLYYSKDFEMDCTLYRRPLGGSYTQEEAVGTFDADCGIFYLCGDDIFFKQQGSISHADIDSPGDVKALFKYYGHYRPAIYADDDYVFVYEVIDTSGEGRALQMYSRADGTMTRHTLGAGTFAKKMHSSFYYSSADKRIYGYEDGRMIYFTPESLESDTYYVPEGAWSQAGVAYVSDITLAGDWFYCLLFNDAEEGMNYRISQDGTQGRGLVAFSPDDPGVDARTELSMEDAWEAGLVTPEDVQAAEDAMRPESRTGIMGGWAYEGDDTNCTGLVFDFYSESGVVVYATEDNARWMDNGRGFLADMYEMENDVGYDRALDYLGYNLSYKYESGYLDIYGTYSMNGIYSYIVQREESARLSGQSSTGKSFTLSRISDDELKAVKTDFLDRLEALLD